MTDEARVERLTRLLAEHECWEHSGWNPQEARRGLIADAVDHPTPTGHPLMDALRAAIREVESPTIWGAKGRCCICGCDDTHPAGIGLGNGLGEECRFWRCWSCANSVEHEMTAAMGNRPGTRDDCIRGIVKARRLYRQSQKPAPHGPDWQKVVEGWVARRAAVVFPLWPGIWQANVLRGWLMRIGWTARESCKACADSALCGWPDLYGPAWAASGKCAGWRAATKPKPAQEKPPAVDRIASIGPGIVGSAAIPSGAWGVTRLMDGSVCLLQFSIGIDHPPRFQKIDMRYKGALRVVGDFDLTVRDGSGNILWLPSPMPERGKAVICKTCKWRDIAGACEHRVAMPGCWESDGRAGPDVLRDLLVDASRRNSRGTGEPATTSQSRPIPKHAQEARGCSDCLFTCDLRFPAPCGYWRRKDGEPPSLKAKGSPSGCHDCGTACESKTNGNVPLTKDACTDWTQEKPAPIATESFIVRTEEGKCSTKCPQYMGGARCRFLPRTWEVRPAESVYADYDPCPIETIRRAVDCPTNNAIRAEVDSIRAGQATELRATHDFLNTAFTRIEKLERELEARRLWVGPVDFDNRMRAVEDRLGPLEKLVEMIAPDPVEWEGREKRPAKPKRGKGKR